MPAGKLSELVAGLPQKERYSLKSEGLAALISSGTFKVGNITVSGSKFSTYTLNDITIKIDSVSVKNSCLSVVLTASDKNGPLPVPNYKLGDSFLFLNPPVMERTGLDAVSENPIGVAKQFIYDAVVTYARNHGWNG